MGEGARFMIFPSLERSLIVTLKGVGRCIGAFVVIGIIVSLYHSIISLLSPPSAARENRNKTLIRSASTAKAYQRMNMVGGGIVVLNHCP